MSNSIHMEIISVLKLVLLLNVFFFHMLSRLIGCINMVLNIVSITNADISYV